MEAMTCIVAYKWTNRLHHRAMSKLVIQPGFRVVGKKQNKAKTRNIQEVNAWYNC